MTMQLMHFLNAVYNQLQTGYDVLSIARDNLNHAIELSPHSNVLDDMLVHLAQTKELLIRDAKALEDHINGVKDIDETQKQP